MENKEHRKMDSREAFLRRLQCYWNCKGFPKFNTYVGEIYEVDFGENVGSEFSGRHLAICLADTLANDERMLVVPLTTKYEHYNLPYIITIKSYVQNKIIKAGVALNEAKLISKLRVFQVSKILSESPKDKVIPVGKISLTKSEIEIFKEVR